MELVLGKVKVEWVELGEGLYGDYDPDDPYDIELLRFDVSVMGEDGEWKEVPDASYCTRFPASASDKMKAIGLELLMDELYEPVSQGHSVKRLCENLSWIGLDWIVDVGELIERERGGIVIYEEKR